MPEDPSAAIARIDATMTAMLRQLDYSERNAAQMVRLAEEKLTFRFDTIDKRLEQMEKAAEIVRLSLEKKDAEIDKRLSARDDEMDERLTKVEKFNARLAGAIGLAAGLSGLATALILKAIGG